MAYIPVYLNHKTSGKRWLTPKKMEPLIIISKLFFVLHTVKDKCDMEQKSLVLCHDVGAGPQLWSMQPEGH